ncbi:MAG: hypothetical protein EAZ30_00405 [Betaproteobacteria bacterium]|nr:MAG: hypothetical protein EAZ30_00405 [Betaproteobacteria bacterium]
MTSLNSATGEERTNAHSGSSFDDFLRDEGIFEETQAKASDRARKEQSEDSLICEEHVGNKLPTLPGCSPK